MWVDIVDASSSDVKNLISLPDEESRFMDSVIAMISLCKVVNKSKAEDKSDQNSPSKCCQKTHPEGRNRLLAEHFR